MYVGTGSGWKADVVLNVALKELQGVNIMSVELKLT